MKIKKKPIERQDLKLGNPVASSPIMVARRALLHAAESRVDFSGGPQQSCDMRKKAKPREPQQIPEPVELVLKPSSYQPSKAEMEEEFDMPGLSMNKIRAAFFRPFAIRREDSA